MTSVDGELNPNTLKILRRPSAFEALDDQEAQKTLVNALALEMTPRERAQGFERLSLWGFSDVQQRDRIIAAFLSHRQKSGCLSLYGTPPHQRSCRV